MKIRIYVMTHKKFEMPQSPLFRPLHVGRACGEDLGYPGDDTGENISAPDLRAGAALVLAAMSAEGFSTVDDIRYIERGYEDFHLKLQGLGAQIELVETERDLQKFKLKIG